jgi:predicted ribosomally synthesized peptide with nif11-like leader
MSIESAKLFVERMKDDVEFSDSIRSATDKNARVALAKAEGFDFSREELASVTASLDESELSSAAGGCGNFEICSSFEDM